METHILEMRINYAVSVIMPVYNAERYLALSIESILSQTMEEFELILVDDGSTDHSAAIAGSYKDSRIVRVSHKVNRGNYSARNSGLKIARGRYLCVMDADDLAYPHRLQTQMDYLNSHPKLGLIGALADRINHEGIIIGTMQRPLTSSAVQLFLLKENCFIHPSIMVRAEWLKKERILYDEEYVCAGDYDFVSRCAQRFLIKNLNQRVIQYRVHETQISQTRQAQQIAYADGIRLKQLTRFGLEVSDKEKKTHLKMMKGEKMSEEELMACATWCERLSTRNARIRAYPPEKFNQFLRYVLGECLRARTA